MKYGRLSIIEEAGQDKHRKRLVKCRCDCGTEVVVNFRSLITGNTKSCGCYHREVIEKVNVTHGMTYTPLYNTWRGMKERCLSSKNINYKNYGARGITVCEEWMPFDGFMKWAQATGYKDGMTIERKDNNGNYEPDNCTWATMKEQNNHKRSNRVLSYNGRDLTVAQWSAETKISYRTILDRLNSGWTVENALSVPVGAIKTGPKPKNVPTYASQA
jgi:hypothetical protein